MQPFATFAIASAGIIALTVIAVSLDILRISRVHKERKNATPILPTSAMTGPGVDTLLGYMTPLPRVVYPATPVSGDTQLPPPPVIDAPLRESFPVC